MTDSTKQTVFVIFAVALGICLPLSVIGMTILVITRDSVGVQDAVTYYTQIASIVSVVLGGLGVTHLITSRPGVTGAGSTAPASGA